MHPYVHCSIIHNSQDTEATYVSINRGIDKEDIRMSVCVCVCVCKYTFEYYFSSKKQEILLFATTWMDREGITLSEVSLTEKDKYLWFHSYVES